MKKEAAKKPKKQEGIPAETSMVLGQLVLPMMSASEALKKGLLAFVQQIGLLAFRELLEAEAAQLAGPKGKHNASRTHHHWGTAATVLPFGGRHAVHGDAEVVMLSAPQCCAMRVDKLIGQRADE